jgi:hypothetical protein|nr:MAG TPA: hypothetical protein [Caudoviricetes sp.]
MAKVEYKKEDIQLLTALLNMVAVKGFDNIKLMAQAAAILDSGIVKEIPEKPQQSGKEAKNEAN